MPDTLPNEVNRLAYSPENDHGAAVSAVAVLLHVSECLFAHYGRAHGVDLLPLLAVQWRCVESFKAVHGLSPGAVSAALADLRRANTTVGYLESLPE